MFAYHLEHLMLYQRLLLALFLALAVNFHSQFPVNFLILAPLRSQLLVNSLTLANLQSQPLVSFLTLAKFQSQPLVSSLTLAKFQSQPLVSFLTLVKFRLHHPATHSHHTVLFLALPLSILLLYFFSFLPPFLHLKLTAQYY